MNFHDALISVYCENPCQVLPNALWKTWAQFESLQTAVHIEQGKVSRLVAWDEKRLFLYWTRDRDQLPDLRQQFTDLHFALIHQDYLHAVPAANMAAQQPYFRLISRQNDHPTSPLLPSGFSLVQADAQEEAQQVAAFIGQCYQDMHPSAETVKSWSQHPVFDAALWIWVMDEASGIPVGLGIAEIDREIAEGALEWIQVLPGYRGRGIGKSIVRELLSRLEKRAQFTTVAGEVMEKTNPETMYRSCGFKGSDIWWVLKFEDDAS